MKLGIEHSADSDTSFFGGCRPNEQQPSIEIEMQSIKLPSITQCPGADVLTIGSVGCRVCNADEHQKCLQTCARLALKFQLSVLGLAPQCPGTQEQTCTTVSRLGSNIVARAACLGAHLFSIGTSLSRLPVTHQSDRKQVVALVLGDLKATPFSFPRVFVNRRDKKTSPPGSRDGSRRHVTKYLDMRSLNSS